MLFARQTIAAQLERPANPDEERSLVEQRRKDAVVMPRALSKAATKPVGEQQGYEHEVRGRERGVSFGLRNMMRANIDWRAGAKGENRRSMLEMRERRLAGQAQCVRGIDFAADRRIAADAASIADEVAQDVGKASFLLAPVVGAHCPHMVEATGSHVLAESGLGWGRGG